MKPTQEQVIAWARAVADKDKVDPINSMGDMITLMLHEFSNAMSLAYEAGRKDENEACANVCDRFQERDVGMQPAECAGAIRARREQ